MKSDIFGNGDQRMLNRIYRTIGYALVVLTLLLPIIARDSSSTFQQCISHEAGQKKEESAARILIARSFAFECTGDFLNANGNAITAIETGLIAFFTFTLWGSNREQIRHNRKTERAYLWPGFAPHLRHHPIEGGGANWNMSILNTGRTAGILHEIYHALVLEDDFTAGRFRYTRVKDRGEIIPPSRPGEETPSDINAAVRTGTRISCGYIVYTDVYRERHYQGWKHRLDATGDSEPLPGCYNNPPDKNHRSP